MGRHELHMEKAVGAVDRNPVTAGLLGPSGTIYIKLDVILDFLLTQFVQNRRSKYWGRSCRNRREDFAPAEFTQVAQLQKAGRSLGMDNVGNPFHIGDVGVIPDIRQAARLSPIT